MPLARRTRDWNTNFAARARSFWSALPLASRIGLAVVLAGSGWASLQWWLAPGSLVLPFATVVIGLEVLLFGIAFG